MTRLQRLQLRQSEQRQALGVLLDSDEQERTPKPSPKSPANFGPSKPGYRQRSSLNLRPPRKSRRPALKPQRGARCAT